MIKTVQSHRYTYDPVLGAPEGAKVDFLNQGLCFGSHFEVKKCLKHLIDKYNNYKFLSSYFMCSLVNFGHSGLGCHFNKAVERGLGRRETPLPLPRPPVQCWEPAARKTRPIAAPEC